MATDTTSLVIKVSTSGVAQADKQLDGLTKTVGQTERATDKATGAVRGLFAAFTAYGGMQVARQIFETADAFQGLQARLVLATGSAEAASKAYGDLVTLTANSHADIQATASLYTKLAQSTRELGIDHESLLEITNTVSNALRVSGASAAESENSIRQLGQAFASGVLRGDEFNSMMENAPRLAKALADSLGVTTGELRKMAADGELTSARLATAFLEQSSTIQAEADKMPVTVGMAMQDIKNAMFEALGPTATGPVVESLQNIAGIFRDPATAQGLANFASGIADVAAALLNAAAAAGNAYGSFKSYFDLLDERTNQSDKSGVKAASMELEQFRKNLAQLEEAKKGGGAWGLFAGGDTGIGIDFHMDTGEIDQQIEKHKQWIAALEKTLAVETKVAETQKKTSTESGASTQKTIEHLKQLDTAKQQKAATDKAAADMQKAELQQQKEYQRELEREAEHRAMAFQSVQEQLLTEEESIRQSYERRKQIIMENSPAGAGRDALLAKNDAAFSKDLMGGWGQEPVTLDSQLAKLQEEFDAKYAQAQGHEELMTELQKTYAEKRTQIMLAYHNQQLDNAAALFDGMAGLAKTFGGEESKAYKVLFATSKAFSIAKAIMNMGVAISQANTVPFPANIAAIASAAAQGASALGTVRGANFSGAYDKGGVIPSGSVGLVGEHGAELVSGSANVLGRKDTAALLENAGGGGKPEVKVLVVNITPDKSEMIEQFKNSDEFDEVVVNAIGRTQNAARQALG